MTEIDWQDWLSSAANYPVELIPCDVFTYLERKGEICLSKAVKNAYLNRAIDFYQVIIKRQTNNDQKDFWIMKKNGVWSGNVLASLITISKRLAVFDYLEQQKLINCEGTNI